MKGLPQGSCPSRTGRGWGAGRGWPWAKTDSNPREGLQALDWLPYLSGVQ